MKRFLLPIFLFAVAPSMAQKKFSEGTIIFTVSTFVDGIKIADDAKAAQAKEVAKFFWKKNDLENASKYFEKGIKKNSDDVEAMELYLEVLIQKQDFQLVSKNAEEYLESFPTQVGFYFYAGLGYNQLKEYKKAKNILENGLDFVVEFNPSESGIYNNRFNVNFYKQLIISCENLNDKVKKETYTNKLKQLQK